MNRVCAPVALLFLKTKTTGGTSAFNRSEEGFPLFPDGKIMYFGRGYEVCTGWSDPEKLDSDFEEITIIGFTASAKGT